MISAQLDPLGKNHLDESARRQREDVTNLVRRIVVDQERSFFDAVQKA